MSSMEENTGCGRSKEKGSHGWHHWQSTGAAASWRVSKGEKKQLELHAVEKGELIERSDVRQIMDKEDHSYIVHRFEGD